jgi:hypothetical protein
MHVNGLIDYEWPGVWMPVTLWVVFPEVFVESCVNCTLDDLWQVGQVGFYESIVESCKGSGVVPDVIRRW